MNQNNTNQPQQSREPRTIEELRQWYEMHHLPPEEVTRFFIGKNITAPKAFGIYKNERGECVVYKNKATGERAIRYQGFDEAHAVNEIHQRLRQEIAKQKSRTRPNAAMRAAAQTRPTPTKRKGMTGIFTIIAIAVVGLVMNYCDKSIPNGYYDYQGSHYYHQGASWFLYNALSNDWFRTGSLDDRINRDNADMYRIDHFNGRQFEDTQWYDDGSSSSWDDDDDDDDWDDSSDSWDSDDTDWDSDW